jgi:thioredoxin 1
MTMTRDCADTEPARDTVDALPGPTLLEFGASWCGHCIAAQPLLERTLGLHPDLRHIRIEDGRGRPLGRSYRVKLWPTLVFLRDGEEIERLVRPTDPDAIADALQRIDPR